MEFRGDERAQPVLIGFLLLFAMLVVAFGVYQGVVVPNQNADVEFSHSQQVESQFSEFRSNVVNAIESGDERSTSFTLGTGYPARLIALNPRPAAGSIETTDPDDVAIHADGLDVADVCGETDDGRTYSSSLVYSPGYNAYDNAGPIIYENTFVTRQFQDGGVVYGDHRFVRESGGQVHVDLQLLTGSVSENGAGSYGLDVRATHRNARSFQPDEDFSVVVPSKLDAETWSSDVLDAAAVVDVQPAAGQAVNVTFRGDGETTYRISCAVIGLDGEPAFQPPGGDRGAGVGQGGTTTWSPTEDTQRISQAGGVWDAIDSVDSIILSAPRLSPLEPEDGSVLEDERVFRLGFSIGGPDDTRYVFTVTEAENGLQYDMDGGWANTEISVLEETDGESSELLPGGQGGGGQNARLSESALNDWLHGDELNLLDPGVYDDPDDVREELGEIHEYLFENGGHDLFVTDATGRVDLRVADTGFDPNAPVLTVHDFSVADQEEDEPFDIQVDVSETNDFETENLVVELVIEDADGNEVDFETQSPGDIQDDTITVTFEDMGPLSAGEDYEAVVTADADNARADTNSDSFDVVEELPDPPSFTVLTGDEYSGGGGDRFVDFTWDVDGSFDQVILQVFDDIGDDNPIDETIQYQRDGTETLDSQGGQVDIRAVVEGSGGTQECTFEGLGNGGEVDLDDFDCISTQS